MSGAQVFRRSAGSAARNAQVIQGRVVAQGDARGGCRPFAPDLPVGASDLIVALALQHQDGLAEPDDACDDIALLEVGPVVRGGAQDRRLHVPGSDAEHLFLQLPIGLDFVMADVPVRVRDVLGLVHQQVQNGARRNRKQDEAGHGGRFRNADGGEAAQAMAKR